jgi:hypothetical protein
LPEGIGCDGAECGIDKIDVGQAADIEAET